MTALSNVDALHELSLVCDRVGKPFPQARRLVDRLTDGRLSIPEAVSIVERLMKGGTTVEESSDPIGTALAGLETKQEQVERRLQELDDEKAELRDQKKQLTAAVKAIQRIAGKGSPRVTGAFTCDDCDKSFASRQGLSTHRTRIHAAA